MVTDNISGHKIERYASAEELPIKRFMMFNRFVMLDSGIGSDLSALDRHDAKIIRMIRSGNTDEAIQIVKNRNQSVRWVMENIHPGLMSYACLVRSIDGKAVYDYSEDGCKKMIELFSSWGAKRTWIQKIVDLSKKKFQDDLDVLIPEVSDSAELKEAYGKRKKRLLLLLEKIINPSADIDELINKIDDFLLSMFSVKSYSGSNGEEANRIRAFEEMSFVLSQHSSRDSKEMTTVEYFQGWKTLKAQLKRSRKKGAL